MKRSASAGLTALFVVALSACEKPPPCPTCPPPPAPEPAVDTQAEAEKIRQADAALVAAIAAHDADKVLSFYASDARFLEPNSEEKTGEAIRESWTQMFGMQNVSLTFAPTTIEVDKDGEMAIDVGTYQFSFDGPKGKVEDHGKYVEVWEKKNGEWKIAVDTYNTSVPMEATAAPPAAKK